MTLTSSKSSRFRCCRELSTLKKTTRLAPAAADLELDLLGLAQADQVLAVGDGPFLPGLGDHIGPGRLAEGLQFRHAGGDLRFPLLGGEQTADQGFFAMHWLMKPRDGFDVLRGEPVDVLFLPEPGQLPFGELAGMALDQFQGRGQIDFAAQMGRDLLVAQGLERAGRMGG